MKKTGWNWRATTGVFAGIVFILFMVCLYEVMQVKIANLPSTSIVNVVVDLMGTMVIFFLMISCIMDDDVQDKSGTFFRVLMFLEAATLFLDAEGWIINGMVEFRTKCMIVNTLYYANSIFMVLAFWFFMNRSEGLSNTFFSKQIGVMDIVIHSLALIGMVPLIINPWTGWIFIIDENGYYYRQPLFILAYIVPIAIMLITTVYISKSKKGWRHKISLYMYILFPLAATIVQIFSYGLSLMYMGVLAAIILVYTNVYVQRGREIAIREQLLAKQNLQIMLSQIQPHFIYNTLGTIRGLCMVNPELAGKTTENFAKYLRAHLDAGASLEHSSISVLQEVENTRVYSEIEQVRFPGIKVIYEITDTGFDVPAFSIQPMVENAIKHGIRDIKEGRVTVRTSKTKDYHVVEIIDNGVGIEVTRAQMDPKRSHIGMANVKARVEQISNGVFLVDSKENEGTTIRMLFPILMEEKDKD